MARDLENRIKVQPPAVADAPAAAPAESAVAGERRKKLTVDLDFARYRRLSILSLDLSCSRVEIIRALLDELTESEDLEQRVGERLASGDLHRPKGFAARPDLAREAGKVKRKIR